LDRDLEEDQLADAGEEVVDVDEENGVTVAVENRQCQYLARRLFWSSVHFFDGGMSAACQASVSASRLV